jgi:ComF family protein
VLIEWLGHVLSPPRCAACEAAVPRAHVFCAACAATVERCGANETATKRAAGAFDGDHSVVDVAFGYYGGALATAIRRLKYEDRPYLARPLGELLRGACRAAEVGADVVLPVPLHPRRLVERGYNQAALLAAHVAREIDAPLITTALARNVDTVAQVTLSGAGRAANLAAAIGLTPRASVEGQVVALVDDVSTTGATLRACCDALLVAGARRVVGVVLARSFPAPLRIPLGLDTGAVPDIGVYLDRASSGCANVPLRANLRN